MSKHEYGGDINLSFFVESDEPLDYSGLLQKIADQIQDIGIADGQLSEVDHYIDGQLQEKERN